MSEEYENESKAERTEWEYDQQLLAALKKAEKLAKEFENAEAMANQLLVDIEFARIMFEEELL